MGCCTSKQGNVVSPKKAPQKETEKGPNEREVPKPEEKHAPKLKPAEKPNPKPVRRLSPKWEEQQEIDFGEREKNEGKKCIGIKVILEKQPLIQKIPVQQKEEKKKEEKKEEVKVKAKEEEGVPLLVKIDLPSLPLKLFEIKVPLQGNHPE